jgi:hypothetical protein
LLFYLLPREVLEGHPHAAAAANGSLKRQRQPVRWRGPRGPRGPREPRTGPRDAVQRGGGGWFVRRGAVRGSRSAGSESVRGGAAIGGRVGWPVGFRPRVFARGPGTTGGVPRRQQRNICHNTTPHGARPLSTSGQTAGMPHPLSRRGWAGPEPYCTGRLRCQTTQGCCCCGGGSSGGPD